VTDPVVWDSKAPPGLRRVLQDLVEDADPEDGGPVVVLARLQNVPTPSDWGNDAALWIRNEVRRLDSKRVYEFTESLIGGNSRFDRRVNDALAGAHIDLEMIDGVFQQQDAAADEFEVRDAVQAPVPLLQGRFSPARQQWEESRQALTDRKYELAVQQAVNALESVVRVISGASKISAGLKKLFPTGERSPLVDAINQLHNYGSAMPGVRHGGQKLSNLTAAEARGVCRAAAVWIVMLIDLDARGAFPVG
jgi:hypothetical protein